MFEGFDRSAVDFLWGMRLNNNKNWYEEHKEDYKQNLARPMKSLCEELFCDFYGEIGYDTISSVSRIVKDARFPHAYPYRDNSAGSMQKFRNAIEQNPDKFSKLVKTFNKQKIFTLDGDFYKRKKGEVTPLLDGWYNRKSISCSASFTYENETVFTPDLKPFILDGFRTLYPICRFIHNAINEE